MISIFLAFGKRMRSALEESKFEQLIQKAGELHPFFTPENIRIAVKSIADRLNEEDLNNWLQRYLQNKEQAIHRKNMGIICAGNIPLVGFADLLAVCASGHFAQIKCASDDPYLLPWTVEILREVSPDMANRIRFVEKLEGVEALIATGSNNSARYFEYEFGNIPRIIRKNRNSIAILKGNESAETLALLADDIGQYYGMGCRNVSKLYVPESYNLDFLKKELICKYSKNKNNTAYRNQYYHQKALYLLNEKKFIDAEVILLREDAAFTPPIAVLHYQYYQDEIKLRKELDSLSEQLQCRVGVAKNEIPFGYAQNPCWTDYADGIDTLSFLINLDL